MKRDIKVNYPDIPKKYRNDKTSGLTAVVKPGDNDPFIFGMQ